MSTELPVRVLDVPHWRVNIRQRVFEGPKLASLDQCIEAVRATRVSLRGWDYPHLSQRQQQIELGETWIASWVDFNGHIEYWRFYQSGQFIHLFSVQEAQLAPWRAELQRAASFHALGPEDWDSVPGYFSLLSFLYHVTEVFEFAARLAQRGIYTGEIEVSIELKGIKGFVLTPDLDRAWSGTRRASQDKLGHTWVMPSSELVAKSPEASLQAVVWFFERFGWLQPATEVLARDQARFLSGQR